jgi:hypothetical protein
MSELTDLFKDVAAFGERCREVGEHLKQAGENLAQCLCLPSDQVIGEFELLRQQFEILREQSLGLAAREGIGDLPLPDMITSSSTLQDLLDRIAALEAKRGKDQQQALDLLERVLRIGHRDELAFVPLVVCLGKASELRNAIAQADVPTGHAEVADLIQEKHPLCDLLALAEHYQDIDNTRWDQLEQRVRQFFSPDLARAALRAKLCLTPVPQPAEPSLPPAAATILPPAPEQASSVPGKKPVAVPLERTEQAQTAGPAPTEQAEPIPPGPTRPAPLEIVLPEPRPAAETGVEVAGKMSASPARVRHVPASSATTDLTPEAPDHVPQPAPVAKPEVPEPFTCFAAPWTTQQVAAALRDGKARHRAAGLTDLAWRLLVEKRVGLAYHLTALVEELYPDRLHKLPSVAVRALALSPLVRFSSGEVIEELRQLIPHALPEVGDLQAARGDWGASLRLLLFSLAIRPALLAPLTGAGSVLEQLALDDSFNALHGLRQAILDYTRIGLELSPSILKGVREHAAWEQRLRELRTRCREWLEEHRQKKIIYAHSTNVWQRWLRDEGMLGSLLRSVIEDQRPNQEQVRSSVRHLSYQATIYDKLARTDKELRGRQADLRPIQDRARPALFRHTQEALQWGQRWLELLVSEPRGLNDFRYQQADQCRNRLMSQLQRGKEELVAFATAGGDSLPAACSAAVALAALQDLESLLDPNAPEAANTAWPRDFLHAELLRLPDLAMDEQWEPQAAPQELLEAILQLVADDCFDWQTAFETHNQAENHLATQRILDYLQRVPEQGPALAPLQREWAERVQECRAGLQREVQATLLEIERAVSYDLLAESDRLELAARIADIVPDQVLDFRAARGALQEVRQRLTQRRDERSQQVRQRLKTTDISQSHPEAFVRIESALQAGHFLEANEYIDLVQSGQSLPEAEEVGNPFDSFFPDFVLQLSKFLESSPEMRAVREEISRGGRVIGPLNLKHIQGTQAANAGRMLETWLRAKSRQPGLRDVVSELLTGFGFKVLSVSGKDVGKGEHEWRGEARMELIAERSICPVPQFGSLANGRYRLLGLWDRPSEDVIVNLAERKSGDVPLIVLYFGRMVVPWRRELAELCRKRRAKLLLLDESLVFYLCGERSRLPVLFSCTLPFTTVDPYTTTAGLVPQEMFFGREHVRKSIIDPLGTSLVYGGRQLGKTALLRDVERRYHDPAGDSIIKWIDLKAEGIGINRRIEEIWSVLANTLHHEGVISSPQISTSKTLSSRIQDWLGSKDQRRIVLLLDEADAFLDGDSKERSQAMAQAFPNLGALKGIMDATDRRFKVVFAGLHNVQRTARDINSPLPHLGHPQCIGPLLEAGEWREAMRLIQLPFRALGYHFEPPDLPLRILSHTNYYPSLIQLFCKHLLSHLTNPNKPLYDSRQCPPYVITAQHLEDAYQSEELRKAIRDRFTWTLNLDPRYRVIALCIALASAENRAEGVLVEGIEVSWVREQALGWWDKGFQDDASLEAFRTILEEMIGLGVLRKVGQSRYALRSPNVLNLMGSRQEIEEQLLDAARSAPAPKYEAVTFRRSLREDVWRLSPLTAQQESELFSRGNGVVVLFGAPVAGLSDVPKFLEAALPGDTTLVAMQDVHELGAFRRRVSTAYEEKHEGLLLIVVPPTSLWSEQWVQEAVAYIAPKRSKQKFARILFLGDSQNAWSWMQVDEAVQKRLQEEGVLQQALKPWNDSALRRWMLDAGFGPHDDDRERQRFYDVTGGWSELVHEVGQRCRASGLHRWPEHLATLERELVGDGKWQEQFGLVRETLPVLRVFTMLDMPLDQEDIIGLQHELPPEKIARVVGWADLLQFLSRGEQGKWALNPGIRRVLDALA